MSSPPEPRTFEGLIAEEWGTAALSRSDVMALLEPYREIVQTKLDDFDDETQSWRSYCGCIWGYGNGPNDEGAIPSKVVEAVRELLKRPEAAPVEVSIPQPKPSASKLSVPVLHGLTLNQLEATRGYCETVASVLSMRKAIESIAEAKPSPTLAMSPALHFAAWSAPFRVGVKNLEDGARGEGPYEDGVRYALTLPKVATAWQEIADVLARWKR